MEGHWAENVFQWAVRNTMIEGYEDGSFRPDKPMTEAEFLKTFYRAFGAALPAYLHSDWTEGPYRLASMWNQPVNGATDISFRNKPITRMKVAELITAASGVHYEANLAIQYVLGHHLASGKKEATIEGFEGSAMLTRAEAVQWIRNLKIHGMLTIQKRPEALSDPAELPALPTVADPILDFVTIPLRVEDLDLIDNRNQKRFNSNTKKELIEAQYGSPAYRNVFHMDVYNKLSVHYTAGEQMDAWRVSDDRLAGTDFQTSKGIRIGESTLSDLLKTYGTAAYNGTEIIDYLYERVDGELQPKLFREEIRHPEDAYVLSFIIDNKTLKVSYMYASTYKQAYNPD